MGGDRDEYGTQYFEANTELKHSAFSRVESAVVPFEVRDVEHTPETDLTRHHQVLKEGDKFESSFLRLDKCCFLALFRVDKHLVAGFVELSEDAFGQISLPGEECKLFYSNCLSIGFQVSRVGGW